MATHAARHASRISAGAFWVAQTQGPKAHDPQRRPRPQHAGPKKLERCARTLATRNVLVERRQGHRAYVWPEDANRAVFPRCEKSPQRLVFAPRAIQIGEATGGSALDRLVGFSRRSDGWSSSSQL